MGVSEDWLTQFDKSAVEVTTMIAADESDRQFWLSRTPIERLQALEHIRQLAWGYTDDSQPEFPRSIEVLEFCRS